MISSALRPFLMCFEKRFVSSASPTTSRVKSSDDSFSAITPLEYCQPIAAASIQAPHAPLDYLVVELLQALLDLGNVDILAPRLFAFPGRLLVLLGGIRIARQGLEDGHCGEVRKARGRAGGRTVATLVVSSLLLCASPLKANPVSALGNRASGVGSQNFVSRPEPDKITIPSLAR
jgi:hypothetical protein